MKLFEDRKSAMEQFTLKKFIDLPAGNKGQLKAFSVYSTYCLSINDPLDESLFNLNGADYHALCTNLELYDPDIKTPAPKATSQSGSKDSGK